MRDTRRCSQEGGWIWGRAVVSGASILTGSLHCVYQGRTASSRHSRGTWWDETSLPWPWRGWCSSSSLFWSSTDSSSGPGELFLRTLGAPLWGSQWSSTGKYLSVVFRLNWAQSRWSNCVPEVDIPSLQHCQSWELESRSYGTALEMIFLLKNRWKGWLFLTLPPKTCECKASSSEWWGWRRQAGKAEDSRWRRPEWHLGNQGADQGEAVNTGCDSLSVTISTLTQGN